MAENSKRGSEWPTPLPAMSDFVTAKQFSDFIQEFRGFVSKVDNNFHEIRKELAEGATKFALIEREVREHNERADDHSGKIHALEKKEDARALEENFEVRAAAPKPHGAIASALISAAVTVGVTAACALGYWALSSYFQSQSTSPPPTASSKPTP